MSDQISKSSIKTEPVKDKAKSVTVNLNKKIPPESPTKLPTPNSSPSSSSLSEDFCGFQELTESQEQIRKKEALDRLVSSLEDVGDSDRESEGETEGEVMTAEDGDAADSDSNQMEIDEGNSRADSAEFSDKNDKGKMRDSDVDVVEIDSVKSGEDTSVKTGEKGAKTVKGSAAMLESEHQPKVEYCGTCNEVVEDTEEGICCDGKCERWFHLQCSGLTQAEYEELSGDENAKWACSRCSGKPPPEIKPGAKPFLTVRKDLTAIDTPSPKRKMPSKDEKRPRVDISNPVFLKPFDYGWKRELVYRSTVDNQNKKQGDVYYYTPKGKKLRSLREISEHLIGTDLTVDNFTFWKDAIGCDPEKEIIRDAKIKQANKDSAATPSPAAKRLATPKTPKTPKTTPKTTPKLTATVTPLDSTSGLPVAKASASVTPRVVLKSGRTGSISTGPKFKVTPSKATTPGQTQKMVISKDKKKKSDSDDELEMGMLPPTWDPVQKPKENNTTAVKRPLEEAEGAPSPKRAKTNMPPPNRNIMQDVNYIHTALLLSFEYLKVQELLRASRVCKFWNEAAHHKSLWETVKMKNSHVKDWEGFSATLRSNGTRHLDLRKMLMPDKPEALRNMWNDCIKALNKINSLVKLDLCRCTSPWLEQIAAVCPQLEHIAAGAIKSNALNFTNFKNCQNLTELRLKSLSGMDVNNIEALESLPKLKSLSLTTVKNINTVLEVLPKFSHLETLELGDMLLVEKDVVKDAFSKLTKLRRLRLEKGGDGCPTDTILETISQLPGLIQLELINFDVKIGFDEALGKCTNIKVLLIIPTYVTQSATTNHLVIEGVSNLSKTLVHFVWGLTLELLRVTDLFIDQWEMNKNSGAKSPSQAPKKASGDSIPILKPQLTDGKKPKEGAVTQVDVLQLPKLHKVLTTLLPNTRIIILKVPFSATWRQTISGSTQ